MAIYTWLANHLVQCKQQLWQKGRISAINVVDENNEALLTKCPVDVQEVLGTLVVPMGASLAIDIYGIHPALYATFNSFTPSAFDAFDNVASVTLVSRGSSNR